MLGEGVGLGHGKGAHFNSTKISLSLSPTSTEQLQVSPRQQADAFLRSIGASKEGEEELGIEEGRWERMSMSPFLWFCVSLLCERHRPSCVHPYKREEIQKSLSPILYLL